jgi:hypothetical protein
MIRGKLFAAILHGLGHPIANPKSTIKNFSTGCPTSRRFCEKWESAAHLARQCVIVYYRVPRFSVDPSTRPYTSGRYEQRLLALQGSANLNIC